jgi:dephospho-CoA kinase
MLDKYVEMDETVRRYMIENLHKIAQIYHYFKNQFDEMRDERLIEAFGTKTFEDLDIKKVVEQMKYPNVQFCIEDDELNIVLNYWASKYSPLISITMDKDLNVVGISHF